MDFAFTDEQRLLRETVRQLMDTHAPPEYIRRLDREQSYPYELYAKWVEAGLLSLPFVMQGRRPVHLEEPVGPIERSPAWIALGAVASLLFIFVLGRGLSWSR